MTPLIRWIVLVGAVTLGLRPGVAAQSSPSPGGPPQQPARDRPAQQGNPPQTATGAISGRVLAADTGRPVRRARVLLAAGQAAARGVLTDDSGAFELTGLPEGVQAEVAHRLAVMDRTSPDIVKQVESQLQRRLSTVLQPREYTAVGGLTPLVDIINHSDRNTERLILEGLAALDSDIAEQVRARMFMFEDIGTLDDKTVQLLMRSIDVKELAVALKGVSMVVKDKFTANMSERATVSLEEDMDVLGPVRVKQVEEAQASIIRQVRALEESGEIVLARAGVDDDLVS